ncbi:MAG: MATE family efflux transporter [Eubacteriales bacterium]|nr:MATE family efflux transporter [Eubacteriales bacterium]
MKQENKKELFENIPVPKAIMTLAVPTIISQLINVIYNIADTFYVGRTGNPYMIAGVSLSLPVFLITIPIANLFGIGGGSYISRLMGAGKEKEAKSVSSMSFYGSLILSLAYSILVFFFMTPLLKALGASADTMEFAKQYTLYVVVFGTPFVVLSAVESHLLRNTGYSDLASYGLSGGGILNMILDPVFMFILFPKGMEVKAAAVATLLSNIAAFIFLTVVLVRVSGKSPLSLSARDLRKSGKGQLSAICSVGIPSAVLPGLFDVANIVLNSCMAVHGDLQLAAMGIVTKIERIPNAVGIGLSQGMLPLVAYNYSSGNHERMQSTIKTARKMGLITAAVCVVAFELLAPKMVGIFLDSSAPGEAAVTLGFAAAFLRMRCAASPFQFLNYHSSYCLQAMGDGKGTIIHAFGRIVGIYIPAMLILNSFFGPSGLALSLPVGEFLSDFLAIYLLRRWLNSMDKNIHKD